MRRHRVAAETAVATSEHKWEIRACAIHHVLRRRSRDTRLRGGPGRYRGLSAPEFGELYVASVLAPLFLCVVAAGVSCKSLETPLRRVEVKAGPEGLEIRSGVSTPPVERVPAEAIEEITPVPALACRRSVPCFDLLVGMKDSTVVAGHRIPGHELCRALVRELEKAMAR